MSFTADPNKIALIIGIDKYYDENLEQLPSCRKDAKDLSNLLSKERFDYTIFTGKSIMGSTVEKENGWSDIQKTISNFFGYAKPNDTLLFYFSGHGIPKNNEVYMSTPQINPKNPYPEGIALSVLTNLMGESKSKQIVGIIDACYSGAADLPNKVSKRKAASNAEAYIALGTYDKIWKRTRKTKGIYLLLSSQSYETSNAEPNDNSLYTKYLIEGLNGVKPVVDGKSGQLISYAGSVNSDGYITPDSLHEYIYHKVANITEQVPDIKVDRASGIILAYYKELASTTKSLEVVDLSRWVTIHDQGPEETTAAFAAITAMEISLAKQGNPVLLSARFVWEKTKQHDELGADAGTWLTTVAYVIEQFGAPLESDWPYDSNANIKLKDPKTKRYYQADVFRLASIKDIPLQLQLGRPIMAGLLIRGDAWSKSITGYIPNPSKKDHPIGGHAITIVGYDPMESLIHFANSWGTSWGNRGFGSMQEETLEKIQFGQMYGIEVTRKTEPRVE